MQKSLIFVVSAVIILTASFASASNGWLEWRRESSLGKSDKWSVVGGYGNDNKSECVAAANSDNQLNQDMHQSQFWFACFQSDFDPRGKQ